jgi:rhodanese-related sulfurtransferase
MSRKAVKVGLLAIVLLVFVVGWEVAWWLLGVKPMAPWRLKNILKSERESYTVIDVRTPFEYRLFHIEGVPNYPNLLTDFSDLPPSESAKPIVIVCMSGHRSPVMGYRLKQHGLRDVSYLTWGLIGWLLVGGSSRR